MKRLGLVFLASVTLLLHVDICVAQTVLDNGQGILAGGSYHGGDVDAIDLRSGNLVLRIPLFSLPQLGKLSLSFSLVMNSQKFGQSQFCDLDYYPDPNNPVSACYSQYIQTGPVGPQLVMDQDVSVGIIPYPSPSDFDDFYCEPNCPGWDIPLPQATLTDSTGASHVLLYDSSNWSLLHAADGSGYSWQTGYTSQSFQPGLLQVYTGAPWQTLFPNDPNNPHQTLGGIYMLPDGTTIAPGSAQSTIKDRMGNTITYSTWPGQAAGWYGIYSGSSPVGSYPGAVLDSVGRTIPDFYLTPYDSSISASCPNVGISNQPVVSSKTWPVPGPNGGLSLYTFCYTNVTFNTNFNGGLLGMMATQDGTAYYPEAIGEQLVLQSVVLPNGTYWGFTYDSAGPLVGLSDYPGPDPSASPVAYADLKQLRYPSGASISYGYITGADRDASTRSLNDGAGNVNTWQYAYTRAPGEATAPGAVVGYGTVTDPQSNDTVHTFSIVQAPFSTFLNVQETMTQYFQGPQSQNNVLRTTARQFSSVVTNYDYGNYTAVNEEPTSSTDSLTGGASVTTTYSYPGLVSLTRPECILNTNEVCGHWGTGYFANSPFQVSYDQPQMVAVSSSDGSYSSVTSTNFEYLIKSAYLGANIISPVASIQTVDGSTSQVVSQTAFAYDEPNGSPQGLYGNRTSVSRQVDSGGSTVAASTVYNGQGMPTVETDANGNSTVTTYDGFGLFPSKVQLPTTNGVPHVHYYSYDANTGNMNWHTDENGRWGGDPEHTTFFTYADPLGRLTEVLGPSPQYGQAETDIAYNDSTNTATSTVIATPNPTEISRQVYDGWGRTVQQQMSTGTGTIYSTVALDWAGRTVEVWNPSTCDPLAVSSCPGETTWGATSYVYDALGRTVLQCNPDNGNNLPCQPGNSYKQWAYNGTSTTMRDEVFNSTTKITDALGRLTQVLEPGSLSTTYSYDILGNLTHVTQAGNGTETPRQRSFKYNFLSRLLWSNNPETGVVCYGHGNGTTAGCQADGYDADGNLLYKTDALGQVTQYTYDALNRLTRKDYIGSNTPSDLYEYDQPGNWGEPCANATQFLPCYNIGHLTHVFTSDFLAQSVYDYDSMGRVNVKSSCVGALCGTDRIDQHFLYDLAGNQISSEFGYDVVRSLPLGGVASSYDGAGRLASTTKIWDTPGTFTPASTTNILYADTGFDAVGPTSSYVVSGGVPYAEAMQHDTRLRTKSYAVTSSGANPLYSWSLAFTPNSNVLSNNDSVNGNWKQYTYDGLNRLLSGTSANRAAQWSYDSFGNMLSQTVTAGSGLQFSHGYSSPNNRPDDMATWFDGAGNLRGLNGPNELTYNAAGRLASSNFGQTTYEYSGDGTRMAKYNNGVLQEAYLYDLQGRVVTTLDSNYHAIRREAYAGSRHIGTFAGEGNPVGTTPVNGAPLVLAFVDGVGTERARADASGGLCQTTASLPFGDSTQVSGSCSPTPTTFFTGKERDTESGLDYFGARYYGSSMGRFSSPDPSGLKFANASNPQSLNLYSYVRNNPLNSIDPDGLETALYVQGNCYTYTYDSVTTDPDGTTNVNNNTTHFGDCGGSVTSVPTSTPALTRQFISYLGNEISNRHIPECNALANYVDAAQKIGNQGVISALAALTPDTWHGEESALGIATNGSNQTGFYGKNGISGFRPGFENDNDDEPGWNGDQSHHFAAYFQAGAAHPNLSMASPVPALFESIQSPFSPNGGDVRLGYAAQDIGQSFGMGGLKPGDVGNAIRSEICR